MGIKYKGLRVFEENEKYIRRIVELDTDNLPEGEVLVKVMYSGLNYKDALSCIGNKGVTKNYPHTPGVDAVGIVAESSNSKFKEGDEVIVTSYDLGMETDGGFGQYIRVPSNWVIHLPKDLSMLESMILGTAGLTAGMAINEIIQIPETKTGPIVVSGATGGVGSMAVAILNKMGIPSAAITGKEDQKDYLSSIGANEVILRKELEEENPRPLLKSRFSGAVDTVGGPILENILKSISMKGVVSVCGLVASPKLNTSVFPFILRGVRMIGIDSQDFALDGRTEIWNHLAKDWKPDTLSSMHELVNFEGLDKRIDEILKGKVKRKVVLDLWND